MPDGEAPWGPTTSGRPTISYLTQALLQRLGQTSPGNAPATQPTIQMDLGQGPVTISTIGPQGQQLSPSEALLRYKEENSLLPQGAAPVAPPMASTKSNQLGIDYSNLPSMVSTFFGGPSIRSQVHVPADIPPEALNLAMSLSGGGAGIANDALSLRAALPGELDQLGYSGTAGGDEVYLIGNQNGDFSGVLHAQINGDNARIKDLYSLSGPNSFGPTRVRSLLNNFLSLHPEVKTLSGERVSGARFGGQHGLEGTGQETSVHIPSVERVDHDPFAVGVTPVDHDPFESEGGPE